MNSKEIEFKFCDELVSDYNYEILLLTYHDSY